MLKSEESEMPEFIIYERYRRGKDLGLSKADFMKGRIFHAILKKRGKDSQGGVLFCG